jgi:hypothetical protein
MEENQIPGQIFSPCFMTEEEFEEGYKNSVFYVEGNYQEEYRKHIVAMEHIAAMAKVYILKNWQKIEDWSGLEVKVKHGPTGKVTEYFNYVPRDPSEKAHSKTWEEMKKRLDEMDKERHNPIREFNSVVLDPTDGDFSIIVNGNEEHWWIQDEAIIIIADFIEQKLKENVTP